MVRKTAHLDTIALWEVLNEERAWRRTTWRQAAKEMSVAASTFTRLRTYHSPSAEGLIRMLEWLGVSHQKFLVYGRKPKR